jgi:hypothetical protein
MIAHIGLIAKDGPSLVATVEDVVEHVLPIEAEWSGHGAI